VTVDSANPFAWAELRIAELGSRGAPAWAALPAEASHRRFYRAATPGGLPRSFILMTSPPALEQNAQFLRLARLFRARGVGVPEVYAVDETEGWFLLEDLGTRHLADVYPTADREHALAGALEALLELQSIDDPAIPPYTTARFTDELGIFTQWFVEGLVGESPDRAVCDEAFGLLIENVQVQPQCCVHRDWHCRNLLLRPDGGIGVVDFQDALTGPAAYDLASLLRDCYHVFDEAEIDRWRNAYVARSPLAIDAAAFARQLDLTAVQRQLKAVGIFARLQLRDGKSTHLRWTLPVLARLVTVSARYADLAPLARWLTTLEPLAARRLEALA
jgi:hypothetical protein